MPIVERYILRRTITVFFLTLFWTLAVVWTTQVVSRINLVTDSGQSTFAFLHLATLILPSVIPIVVPFAMAIGVAQTLTAMNTDSELAVINAAGSSRMAVVRPILILAGAASIFSFAIDNGAEPYARQKVRELTASARADLLSTLVQEGSFHRVDDGLFVHIGERRPDGRLGGIFVADSREKDADLIYYAKTGTVAGSGSESIMIMEDGVVHRKTRTGDISVIHFTSYSLNLSGFAPSDGNVTLLPKDHTIAYLMQPDPGDKVFQQIPQQFRAEFHRRLSEWTYPFVFALIALAVAGDARSHREARMHPMVTALLTALVIRWLGFFVASKAQTSMAFVPGVYAVPAIAAAVSVYFIVAHRAMELPVSWVERLARFCRRWWEQVIEWRLTLIARRRA
jgi:lipopolysaccharide export system permease protein